MSVKQHTCISIVCDDCGDAYQGYEEQFTVHMDSVEDFATDMQDWDEEQRWSIDGDKHYCSTCACKRETNHALTVDIGAKKFCRCGSNWDGKRASA